MAMVFLSDKRINNTIEKENNKNYYIDNLILFPPKKEEKISQTNKPPFNIKGKGNQDFTILNQNPGPGTYNLSKEILNTKYNYNSNNTFWVKSKRFINNKELEKNPGPGSYNLNEKPLIAKRIPQRPNSNISFKYNTNLINNISTIPSKNQLFGYLENEEDKLIQAIDPLYEKYFSGEKNNSVGPDRYNIDIKVKNPIVNWKRMSARNLDNKSSKNNNNESLGELSKISKLETDISFIKHKGEKNLLEKKLLEKKLRTKDLMDKYKKKLNSSRIIISKKPEIEPIDIQRELEFINYYENKDFNHKGILYPFNFNLNRYQSKTNEFQNFGSSMERGIKKLPLTDRILNPGPGTYFQDTFKQFREKYKNKINPTFSKSKRMENFLNKSSAIGPGEYNILEKGIIGKKSFSNIGTFSSEKRFPEFINKSANDININYNFQESSDNNISFSRKNNIKKIFNIKRYINVEQEIKKQMNKKLKNEKADFNNYQTPEIINVIQNKINSKINHYSSVKHPFMSGLGRFPINRDVERSKNRGPGSYELIKKVDQQFLCHAPFNSSQEKEIKMLNRTNSFISPAKYNIDSYFDWNKKSFNIMFL